MWLIEMGLQVSARKLLQWQVQHYSAAIANLDLSHVVTAGLSGIHEDKLDGSPVNTIQPAST